MAMKTWLSQLWGLWMKLICLCIKTCDIAISIASRYTAKKQDSALTASNEATPLRTESATADAAQYV